MSYPWPVATVQQLPDHTHVDSTKTRAFIQWKGTDVCLDFDCTCGYSGHYDGYFAYTIQCPECHAAWEMPVTIYLRQCDGSEYDRTDYHAQPK